MNIPKYGSFLFSHQPGLYEEPKLVGDAFTIEGAAPSLAVVEIIVTHALLTDNASLPNSEL